MTKRLQMMMEKTEVIAFLNALLTNVPLGFSVKDPRLTMVVNLQQALEDELKERSPKNAPKK